MRFIVDECTGPAVARWLRQQQHDVFSVYEQARGMDDDDIVQKAFAENRIVVTNDKDFGTRCFESAGRIAGSSCCASKMNERRKRLRR